MKLSDIIPDSQSLIVRDYWERRNRLGIPGPEFKPEYANNPDYFPQELRWLSDRNSPVRQSRSSHLHHPGALNPNQSPQNSGQNNQNP